MGVTDLIIAYVAGCANVIATDSARLSFSCRIGIGSGQGPGHGTLLKGKGHYSILRYNPDTVRGYPNTIQEVLELLYGIKTHTNRNITCTLRILRPVYLWGKNNKTSKCGLQFR